MLMYVRKGTSLLKQQLPYTYSIFIGLLVQSTCSQPVSSKDAFIKCLLQRQIRTLTWAQNHSLYDKVERFGRGPMRRRLSGQIPVTDLNSYAVEPLFNVPHFKVFLPLIFDFNNSKSVLSVLSILHVKIFLSVQIQCFPGKS